MLWLVLGLDVTKDVEVSLRDTVMMQVMGAISTRYGISGDYTSNVMSIMGPRVLYNGSILPVDNLNAYNPESGMGAEVIPYTDPSNLAHFYIRLYDIPSGGQFLKLLDITAPSTGYNAMDYKVAPCGENLCLALLFSNYSSGTHYLEVQVIDPTGNSSPIFSSNYYVSISSFDLYGNHYEVPDTVALVILRGDGTLELYALDANLSPSANPVISYNTIGMSDYELMDGFFFSAGFGVKFASLLYNGTSQEAVIAGFDVETGSVFQRNVSVGRPYISAGVNSVGFCMAQDDGTNLFVYYYDIFFDDFYGDTLTSLGGPVSAVFPLWSAVLCGIASGENIEVVDVTGGSIVGTYTFPSSTYDAARYYFDDYSELDNRIHVLGFNWDSPPYDTLFLVELNVGSGVSLSGIDTIAALIPFDPTFPSLQVRDGNLYMSQTGSVVPSRIVKTDLTYNILWEGDTLDGANTLYLPLYVYNNLTYDMRKLDDATGDVLPYSYNLDYSTYGMVLFAKEYGSNFYVLTGDGIHSLHLHVLDTSDLSGSAVDLGITISWGAFDISGDTLAIIYSDFGDGDVKLYLYDMASSTLIGPHSFDYDAAATEVHGPVKIVDGNIYTWVGTSTIQKFVKCLPGLTTCLDADIDPSIYSTIMDFTIDADSGDIFLTTFNSHAIHLDENLNMVSTAGPYGPILLRALPVNEYILLIGRDNYAYILDTTYVMFARRNDLGRVDFADTLVGVAFHDVDIYEYAPEQFYVFLSGSYGLTHLANLIRYDVSNSTGKNEMVISGFRYSIEEGRLILEGRGEVSVRVFDIRGRMVGSYHGSIDGRRSITRFPADGIYLLDINGGKYKVVNINR